MIDVRVHGSTADLHAFVDDGARSFDALCQSLDGSTPSVVTTDVGRANLRNLAELAHWLLDRNVRAWRLRWPARSPEGLAPPRLGLAVPYMLHAAELARRGGLQTWLEGVPTCGLGPHFAARLPSPARAFAAACRDCTARADCCGVPPRYLEWFRDDLELRPSAEPRPADPLDAALRASWSDDDDRPSSARDGLTHDAPH